VGKRATGPDQVQKERGPQIGLGHGEERESRRKAKGQRGNQVRGIKSG